ncbi:MAG TPA: hypothetical protein VI750_07680 [Pyrinomonadaceae bacterium]|nr:hypothetical protein [Pyrinomonadaceae bacterium]HLE63002.1 hypothetical protein [Pyrinomonadaceae bacterium]
MPIKYTNRKGQKYHLHVDETKAGKPRYFFSMNAKAPTVEAVPEGFEIYENPNGQVSDGRSCPN